MNRMILIGDHNRERIDLLKTILQEGFKLNESEIECVASYAQVIAALPKTFWKMVFVADNLPYAEQSAPLPIHQSQVLALAEGNLDIQFCLLTSSSPPLRPGLALPNLNYLFFPLPAQSALITSAVTALVEERAGLKRASRKRKPRKRKIEWNKSNDILSAQIRSLADDRDYEKGKEIIQKWIDHSPDFDRAEVNSLTEGKSGARVFRLVYKNAGQIKDDFILKLGKGRTEAEREKIRLEIRGYLEAREIFPDSDYDARIPRLRPAPSIFKEPLSDPLPDRQESSGKSYVFQSGDWDVISYDFLGGEKFGSFLSLETVLTGDADELWEVMKSSSIQEAVKQRVGGNQNNDSWRIRETRKYILKVILDWLCDEWYQHKELAQPAKKTPWYFGGNTRDNSSSKPLYILSDKAKEEILSFLRSREAKLGERLMIRDWASVHKNVRQFVEQTTKKNAPEKLVRKMTVVTSPIHGDLNANNVLLWVKKCRPFLIDFPFFQKDGHTMRDLARLEVEIKYMLMDRQGDSLLKALDHTYSQIPIWEQLEEYLRSEQYWHAAKMSKNKSLAGYFDNVSLCLEMVQMIRVKADEVRKKILREPHAKGFFDEYYPALLYHTLRAIGYDSLSVFKRLLAVQSAGKIIARMYTQ